MKQQTKDFIGQGYVLVTATNRLARHLQHQYASNQLAAGSLVWQTVDILPWSAWLYRTWEEMASTSSGKALMLTKQQQLAVWQQVVVDSHYASRLLHVPTVARQVDVAWSLCQQWQLPIFAKDSFLNEDARAFQTWASEYERRCQAHSWSDEARLADDLKEMIKSNHMCLKSKIALLGFDEFTPQQQSLLDVLTSHGGEILETPAMDRNLNLRYAGFFDSRDEIMAAGIWARRLLESGATGSIGIVVPNLQLLRHQIENCLDDILLPATILSVADSTPRPYSISMGLPLSSYPIIDIALILLGLGNRLFSLNEIGTLLRSPFIKCATAEQIKRAKLDACLRDVGEQQISIKALFHIASNHMESEDQCTELVSCLHQWQQDFQAIATYQSASQWEGADLATKGVLAAKAKYLCAEAALEATSKAIQVVGGRSINKSWPLERAFRDVRSCTLMPPNNDAMLANIGKAQLGLLGTAFGLKDTEG